MPVESSEEKLCVLRAFSEHLIKGRWQEVRSPSPSELKRGPSKVDLDLGESSEAAVDAACRAGSPWPEQMDGKMLRFVEKTRSSSSQKRSERGQEVVAAH